MSIPVKGGRAQKEEAFRLRFSSQEIGVRMGECPRAGSKGTVGSGVE